MRKMKGLPTNVWLATVNGQVVRVEADSEFEASDLVREYYGRHPEQIRKEVKVEKDRLGAEPELGDELQGEYGF